MLLLLLLIMMMMMMMISRVTVTWTLFLCLVFIGAAVRGAFGKSTVMTMAMHRSRLLMYSLSFHHMRNSHP